MGSTTELLKKVAKDGADEDRQLIIHPMARTRIVSRKKHIMFVKIAILVTYTLIGFMIYDLFFREKVQQNSYVEDFVDIDSVVADVDRIVSKSVVLEIVNKLDIKSEEELIKEIESKSINLPDINTITRNIPPVNIQTGQQQQTYPEPILSRYDFFLKRAKEYEAIGNYRYAIFFYLRAFAERQSDYNTKYKVATLYHQIGQEELAVESAREALSIKSDFLPAVELLINIFNKTGKKPYDFIDILERARSYHPNNREIKHTLARLYKEQGDVRAYEEIISSLKE